MYVWCVWVTPVMTFTVLTGEDDLKIRNSV